MKTEEEKDKK